MTKYSNQDELKTIEGKSGVEKDVDQINEKSKVEEVESGELVEQPADAISEAPSHEPNDNDVETDFEKNNIAIDGINKPNDSNVEEKDNTCITKDKASKSDDSKLDEKSDTSKPSDTKEPPKRRFARDVKKSSESDSRKMARSLLQQKKKPGAVKQKGPGHLNPKKADEQEASKEPGGQGKEAAAVEEIEEYYIALYIVFYSGRNM